MKWGLGSSISTSQIGSVRIVNEWTRCSKDPQSQNLSGDLLKRTLVDYGDCFRSIRRSEAWHSGRLVVQCKCDCKNVIDRSFLQMIICDANPIAFCISSNKPLFRHFFEEIVAPHWLILLPFGLSKSELRISRPRVLKRVRKFSTPQWCQAKNTRNQSIDEMGVTNFAKAKTDSH